MGSNLRVLIDVDDVCGEFIQEVLRWYNLDYDGYLKPSDIKEWNILNYVKHDAKETFQDYFRNAQLYEMVKPVVGALENIQKITDLGCDVFYCTAVVPGGEGIKYNWLVNNGFINNECDPKKYYVEISEKYILDGSNSVLIDDGFHNLESFNGNRILFSRPWNLEQYNEREMSMYRTDDWNEIYEIVKNLIKLKDRKNINKKE